MARDERAEPGELEDLGGAPALDAAARLDAPHEADRARLLRDPAVAVVRAGLVGGLCENRVDGVEEGRDAASARSPPATGFRKGGLISIALAQGGLGLVALLGLLAV